MAISADSLHLTGVKINYFFVCKRKLWLLTGAFEDGAGVRPGFVRAP